jgi:hypothetical protein
MKQFQRGIAEHGFTSAAVDMDETNRLLAGIPDQPDESSDNARAMLAS